MPPHRREAETTSETEPVQLASRAADTIREMIARGELLPGEKIRQIEVAQMAGVSRSPLREALRMLEGEGLVKYETNRGYVVSRLGMSELAEIYRMRSLLESEMVAHINSADPESLEVLEQHLQTMSAAAAESDFDQLMIAYRAFHQVYLRLSGMPIFLGEVQRLWNMTDSYYAIHTLPPATARRIIRDHRAILRALRTGDLPKMREIVAQMPQINEYVVVGLPPWR
jgi:DNA-binding GntR family transcriptional regulator